MDRGMKQAVFGGLLCLGIVALAACATPPAKDFGGRWHPVNQFQSAPERIQLQKPYVFYASPLDGTLKNMLSRWAKDTGARLIYRLPYDYTLYTPVSGVRSRSLPDAVAQLSSIYSDEHVAITTVDHEIIAEPAPVAPSAASSNATAAEGGAARKLSTEALSQSAH